MLKHRVIPSLLLNGTGLVKTKQFKHGVYIGDPINAVRIFNEKEVDELVLLDIRASVEGRGPNFSLLEAIASECFMPLSYGGGVSSINQIRNLLRLGIEKIILNTALHKDPSFVLEATSIFGSQAITASIDVRRSFFGRRKVMILGGNKSTGLEPLQAALRAENLGVGEILLTSIDREGTMNGYDIELLVSVTDAVNIPVIASGGAGCLEHFANAVKDGRASAVCAGSMFVFYGQHRAVLISYPKYDSLKNLFGES